MLKLHNMMDIFKGFEMTLRGMGMAVQGRRLWGYVLLRFCVLCCKIVIEL